MLTAARTRGSVAYPALSAAMAWSSSAVSRAGTRPAAAMKRSASVSTLRQPRLPHGHGRPFGSTLTCPASIDRPPLPV